MTEPSYTSYLGTPRQDVPQHVYTDTAMYEDVFEKKGSFIKNPTHNISCPLSQNYNRCNICLLAYYHFAPLHVPSLHDSHCRHLYLNNHKLREHLINLGLITEDLKIVSSTQQQRQKIRAHEMLERKELLLTRMKEKQTKRLSNLEVHTYSYIGISYTNCCRFLLNYPRSYHGASQGNKKENSSLIKLKRLEEEGCNCPRG